MHKKKVIHKLLLDTKDKIPFSSPSAQLVIYQPSIAEIGMLGEPNFLMAVQVLTKDYKKTISKDNSDLDNLTNFDIIMSIIKEKTENSKLIFVNILQLFELIFPDYKIGVTPNSFIFQVKENNDNLSSQIIDNKNFDIFSQYLYEMFALASFSGQVIEDYNPAGDRARALVEKFKKKHEYLAQLRQEKGEDTAVASIFGRYMNVLAVGERKNKNELSQYSVYQLIEEFKRFELKEAFDYTLQAKMAGAKNVKDAKDWMQDITFGVELE